MNETPSQKPAWLEFIREQVAQLRFGTIQIIVHDSHVVQLETTSALRPHSQSQKPSSDPS